MRVVLLALLFAACGDKESATDSGAALASTSETETTDDGADRILACLAERWVQQTCSGCHLEGSHLDLRFDALESLVSNDREFHPGPIVVPGDADASLLARKLEAKVGLVTLGPDEGEPMPLDSEITEADAQLIRDWVEAGALVPSGC